jgi:hypothetical protein
VVIARVLAAAVGTMAVGTAALRTFGVTGPGRTSPIYERWPFLDMWVRWDAGWYEQIAARGYTYSATEQSAAAFFPVYPLLMRGVMSLGIPVFLAGMLVTWAAGLTSVVLFSRWVAQVKPEAANLSTWLLVLWPFAFFLYGAVYSDAVFLALVTGAFLLLERRQVLPATLLGMLATATRPVGAAVVVGLLVRHFELARREGRTLSPRDALPALAGLGLVAFMVFLGGQFGDPFGFMTTQVGWGQLSGPGAWLKYDVLRTYKPIDQLLPLFHACLAFLVLWLAWRARRTLGWGYAIYAAIAMSLPMASSRDFICMGRYAIAAFPAFAQLALELQPRPRARVGWFVASVAMLVWMTVRFANGRYVS